MESFFSIKLCICYYCLSVYPIHKHFVKVIQPASLVIFEYHSVDNSQASCASSDCNFPVWLPFKLSLSALAVSHAWPCNLKVSWVKCYALVSPSLAAKLYKLAIIARR